MFAPAYMGRKRRGAALFQRFCYAGKNSVAGPKNRSAWSESIGKTRFRPMYARANMGTRPEILGKACGTTWVFV
jgi:hypothetical protein